MSKTSREAIYDVLIKYYQKVGITIINDLSDLENLVSKKPDLVFLGMNYLLVNNDLDFTDQSRIWITDYLDRYNIKYTASKRKSSEYEINKHLAKQLVLNAGFNTSKFYVAKKNLPIVQKDIQLKYPLFIKPTNRGCGIGIDDLSVVHNFKELKQKVESISTCLNSDSIIEEYLPGREFSVAILKNDLDYRFNVMPIELIAPCYENGVCILSKKVKFSNTECAIEITDEQIRSDVSDLAVNVFNVLGARYYGRIDIRMDRYGVPQFLEANLLPSLIDGYGSFPKACFINKGISYESMILQIVRLGLIGDNAKANNEVPIMVKRISKSTFDSEYESILI